MRLALIVTAGIAWAVSSLNASAQSVQRATDRAYDAAAKYQVRGYQPVAGPTGFENAPGRAVFKMACTEGNDYVFIIGTDDVDRIRVYVEDEWGMPLSKDSRGYDMAALAFFARYSGQVKVTVMFDQTVGMGAFSTLVCKRPVARTNMWQMLDGREENFGKRDSTSGSDEVRNRNPGANLEASGESPRAGGAGGNEPTGGP